MDSRRLMKSCTYLQTYVHGSSGSYQRYVVQMMRMSEEPLKKKLGGLCSVLEFISIHSSSDWTTTTKSSSETWDQRLNTCHLTPSPLASSRYSSDRDEVVHACPNTISA